MKQLLAPIRWKVFLTLLIAVSTNHSLGEIVYKNQTKKQINEASRGSIGTKTAKTSEESIRILNIIEESGGEFAHLSHNDGEEFIKGATADIYRDGTSGSIHVGVVQIVETNPGRLIGKIIQNGTSESRILEPDYPSIMIGDYGRIRRIKISKVLQITPSKTISYFDLFDDPNPYPQTFELSEAGKAELEKAVAVFEKSKLPMLLVEGHTNAEGAAEDNQIESYQRALTIRQFLINELGFDPDRVVAIGMGEIEPVEEPYLPDHKQRARRIVLKAKGY